MIAVGPLEIVQEGPQEISPDFHALVHGTLQLIQIFFQKINAVGIMHLTVQGYGVMAGHTVLRDIQRHVVALIKELAAPVNTLRGHGPLDGRLGKSRVTVHILDSAVRGPPHFVAIVHILSHKVQGLGDQLHVLRGNLRQILCETLQALLRVAAQKYGITIPGHIPGPVIQRIVKAEIRFSGRRHILRTVRSGNGHAAGGGKPNFHRGFGIFPQIHHRLAVGLQHIVGDLKSLFIGEF